MIMGAAAAQVVRERMDASAAEPAGASRGVVERGRSAGRVRGFMAAALRGAAEAAGAGAAPQRGAGVEVHGMPRGLRPRASE